MKTAHRAAPVSKHYYSRSISGTQLFDDHLRDQLGLFARSEIFLARHYADRAVVLQDCRMNVVHAATT